MLETNIFDVGDESVLRYSDERFSIGDERVETCIQTSAPHTHTQLATSDFQTELIRDDCYSQVLTFENGR